MSDKSFKVKSGLQIPGVTSANILTTDSSGNVSSSSTLAIANGGTGQTTATNAINALLPLQTSNDNYFLQTSGVSPQWSKVFYQAIKDNGTTVTPRGYLNIVGGTFSDDSLNDITTLDLSDKSSLSSANTFTVGPQTINTGLSSNAGLIIKGAVSQNSGGALTQWLSSTNSLLASVNGAGRIYSSVSLTAGSISVSLGALTAISTSASIIGAVIRGAASQSANLQEWQDSAGTALASITSFGQLNAVNVLANGLMRATSAISSSTVSGSTIVSNQSTGHFIGQNVTVIPNAPSGGGVLYVESGALKYRGASGIGAQLEAYAATDKPLIIKGFTSQSANLQEWQNSAGTLLASISSAGSAWFKIGARVSGNYGGSQALLVQNDQNIIGITVKANSTQTANLTEWQDSAGTVLASLSASGNLMVQNLTVNGTTTTINSTTLTVDDKNIELASVSSPTDTTADGAGITIKGATDKTFNWVQSTAAFTSSEPISAPAFKSAGTAVSSNITLVSGYRYFVDTTEARTLTLPASPSLGDEIQIYDASNSALTNNITVASNSNKIQGSVQDLIIDSNAATVYLTYTGSTYGWAVN